METVWTVYASLSQSGVSIFGEEEVYGSWYINFIAGYYLSSNS
jgi:hypothetical protein